MIYGGGRGSGLTKKRNDGTNQVALLLSMCRPPYVFSLDLSLLLTIKTPKLLNSLIPPQSPFERLALSLVLALSIHNKQ